MRHKCYHSYDMEVAEHGGTLTSSTLFCDIWTEQGRLFAVVEARREVLGPMTSKTLVIRDAWGAIYPPGDLFLCLNDVFNILRCGRVGT